MNKEILKLASEDKEFRQKMIRKLSSSKRYVKATQFIIDITKLKKIPTQESWEHRIVKIEGGFKIPYLNLAGPFKVIYNSTKHEIEQMFAAKLKAKYGVFGVKALESLIYEMDEIGYFE